MKARRAGFDHRAAGLGDHAAARNRATLLQEALDSVAAQTLTEWEHIVVDDGSDDGTAEMMAARAAADPRVTYIVRRTPTSGANVCRNIGIRAAKAPLVVLLDSR